MGSERPYKTVLYNHFFFILSREIKGIGNSNVILSNVILSNINLIEKQTSLGPLLIGTSSLQTLAFAVSFCTRIFIMTVFFFPFG